MADISLDDLLDALLEESADIHVKGGEYVRNGNVFAARSGPNALDLRLGDEIGEAALRTPDASASERGSAWVRLAPRNWKDARDRLEAWFRVAWRLAAKPVQR